MQTHFSWSLNDEIKWSTSSWWILNFIETWTSPNLVQHGRQVCVRYFPRSDESQPPVSGPLKPQEGKAPGSNFRITCFPSHPCSSTPCPPTNGTGRRFKANPSTSRWEWRGTAERETFDLSASGLDPTIGERKGAEMRFPGVLLSTESC